MDTPQSFLLTIISFMLSGVLLNFFLPVFNIIIHKELSFDLFLNPSFVWCLCLSIIFTGLLAGSYPAFLLSKLSTDISLQKRFKRIGKGKFVYSLATLQFISSSFLIICALFMSNQMRFVLNQNLGIEKDFTIRLSVPFKRGEKLLSALRSELANEPSVASVSASWQQIGDSDGVGFQAYKFYVNGEQMMSNHMAVDPEMLQTLRIEMLQGESLDKNGNSEESYRVLVNERFVKETGLTEPVGTEIEFPDGKFIGDIFEKAEIVGIVKDCNCLPSIIF